MRKYYTRSMVLLTGCLLAGISTLTVNAAEQVPARQGLQSETPEQGSPEGKAATGKKSSKSSGDISDLALIPPRQPIKAETIVPEELFGTRSGYFHPFLSLSLKYTDNVYLGKYNPESDWARVVSPGLGLAFHQTENSIYLIPSDNTRPGGLSLFLQRPEGFRRYEGYAYYGADLISYDQHSDRDCTNQTVEAAVKYNLKGGLSLSVHDKWTDSEEGRVTTGVESTISHFKNNLLGLGFDYALSEKLSLRGDYNYFLLDYDEQSEAFMNRSDQGFSLYSFYHYSLKTSFFVEYNYTEMIYDFEVQHDSAQQAFYAGMHWDATVSTQIITKLGADAKEFVDPLLGSVNNFAGELQLGHTFTEKSSITLTATRKTNETRTTKTDYQVKTVFNSYFRHDFTSKISATLSAGYEVNDYRALLEHGEDREDQIYNFTMAAKYKIKDWFMVDALYKFNKRESTDDIFDYEENQYLLSLSAGF